MQIVFDSWGFLTREKGLRLYGYVVLENHCKPKQIGSAEMMLQKLGYIHPNPSSVDDPAHWRYSSVGNLAGTPGLVNVMIDWR